MKHNYTQPKIEVADIAPQQLICASGSGWAEMGGYGTNTDGEFIQTEP